MEWGRTRANTATWSTDGTAVLVEGVPVAVTSRARAKGLTPAQQQIWQAVLVCAAACLDGVFSTWEVWQVLVSRGFGWSRWMVQKQLARWSGFGGGVPDSAPLLLRRVQRDRYVLLAPGTTPV